MRAHIITAIGLLILAIFAYRGANALMAPGFGLSELYVFGGLILGGWVSFSGSSELLARRREARAVAD